MFAETNILKENNDLKEQVKNLSNKIERCYNTKVIHEQMMKDQRNFGDMSGIGFNRNKIKARDRTRRSTKER